MTDGTAETEAPATKISEEMKSLRRSCDMLNIDWHHRNSVKNLQSLIAAWNEQEHAEPEPQPEPQPQPQLQVDVPVQPEAIQPSFEPRVPRTIPPEIVEALTYMGAYHKAKASKVKEFIQGLL